MSLYTLTINTNVFATDLDRYWNSPDLDVAAQWVGIQVDDGCVHLFITEFSL
jgi:hypothetical protein